ncbi:hypothetical protein [Crocosphaera sp.]|uniref:hypothetical protein n=1 Tax=Crocosphaera sp. TaxID=2729996 RepID=UPI003F27D7B1|nr:hypothetical protein [Crocosphaera sp.]
MWTNSLIVGVVALGVGCGLCTGCVVQDREDSRRYQQLYKDDNKRIGMLSGDKKLDPELKLAIQRNLEHNLKEESELLDVPNGDSTTHSLLKEFRLIKLSIANIEKSI